METEKSERGDWVLLISVLQWTAINGDQICPSNWGGESGVGFFFLVIFQWHSHSLLMKATKINAKTFPR